MCVFPKLSVLVKYCKKSVIFSDKMFPCEVCNTHFKENDTLVGMCIQFIPNMTCISVKNVRRGLGGKTALLGKGYDN